MNESIFTVKNGFKLGIGLALSRMVMGFAEGFASSFVERLNSKLKEHNKKPKLNYEPSFKFDSQE